MSSSDSTNLALGILGVLTIIPVILGSIINRLPSARLRYFDELVAETDGFLLSLEEQGIFRNPSTAIHFRARLSKVRKQAEQPRIETYCATSIWQQLTGLFNGLSKKLSQLSSSALTLRAEISTTASEDLAQAAAGEPVGSSSHSESIDAHEAFPESNADCATIPTSDNEPGSQSSSDSLPSVATSESLPPGTSHVTDEFVATRPSPGAPHFGDTPIVVYHGRKRHQSEQYARRNKRYLAARNLSVLSVVQMEHRKSGVMHSDNFKRALRTRTYDSVLSGSTCVSESDSLPVHVKPTGDHRHSGLRRVLGFLQHRWRDEASDTRSSYRVAHWLNGLVPTTWTTD
ncbi:hypothetical protein C8Q74DRAFT_1215887 [Fomes fomentarius]|nr:hypothetical protein C8Q74DRAFT_1215887 [Fomes fomentarius]